MLESRGCCRNSEQGGKQAESVYTYVSMCLYLRDGHGTCMKVSQINVGKEEGVHKKKKPEKTLIMIDMKNKQRNSMEIVECEGRMQDI